MEVGIRKSEVVDTKCQYSGEIGHEGMEGGTQILFLHVETLGWATTDIRGMGSRNARFPCFARLMCLCPLIVQ